MIDNYTYRGIINATLGLICNSVRAISINLDKNMVMEMLFIFSDSADEEERESAYEIADYIFAYFGPEYFRDIDIKFLLSREKFEKIENLPVMIFMRKNNNS